MKNKTIFIGTVIKRLRKARNIKQDQLAFDSRITRKYMSKIERNISEPGLGTIFAIAAGLGMKASELVREFEEYLNTTPIDEMDQISKQNESKPQKE